MRLPISIVYKDNEVYTDVEVESPGAGVIADTWNIIDKTGNSYSALHTWLSKCITTIISESKTILDKTQIRAMIRKIPYKSCEYIAIQTILDVNADDEIEGIYECPRCQTKIICERVEENGEEISNNVDHMSALKINFAEPDVNTFHHDFEDPIKIESGQPGQEGKAILEVIENIDFHYPTLGDCIEAYNKTGSSDKARLQFRIYAEAIDKVNGLDVDNKWRTRWGLVAINKIKNVKKDLIEIFKKGNAFGLDSAIERHCVKCGKTWPAPVNSMNFFGSALRSIR